MEDLRGELTRSELRCLSSCRIVQNLNLDDCIELEHDIKMYLSLEKSPINIEFWEVSAITRFQHSPCSDMTSISSSQLTTHQAMMVVCQYHLQRLRDPDHAEGGRLFDREVDESAGKIVSGLSLQRLIELENRTNSMLRSGQPVDGEFWDLVLRKITVEKAIVSHPAFRGTMSYDSYLRQSKLNSIHEVVLKNRLEQFKKRQREDAAKVQQELGGTVLTTQADANVFGGDMHADIGIPDDADDEMDEDDYVEEYDPEMSPEPLDQRTMQFEERRLPIIDEDDNLRAIFTARRAITSASFVPRHVVHRPSEPTTSTSVIRPSRC